MDEREPAPDGEAVTRPASPRGTVQHRRPGPTPRAVVVLTHVMARVHRAVFRAGGGRVGRRAGGLPVCLLTTRGRRTGERRTTTLTYVRDGEALLVIAADAGSGRLPDWYRNLVAEPRVLVQVGPDVRRMVARTAGPDERARLWPRVVAAADVYRRHEERLGRSLPVVVLEAAGRGQGSDGAGRPAPSP